MGPESKSDEVEPTETKLDHDDTDMLDLIALRMGELTEEEEAVVRSRLEKDPVFKAKYTRLEKLAKILGAVVERDLDKASDLIQQDPEVIPDWLKSAENKENKPPDTVH